MTPELYAYLRSWLTWAENGAPEGEPYHRGVGLCYDAPKRVMTELSRMLGEPYPFGEVDYDTRQRIRALRN